MMVRSHSTQVCLCVSSARVWRTATTAAAASDDVDNDHHSVDDSSLPDCLNVATIKSNGPVQCVPPHVVTYRKKTRGGRCGRRAQRSRADAKPEAWTTPTSRRQRARRACRPWPLRHRRHGRILHGTASGRHGWRGWRRRPREKHSVEARRCLSSKPQDASVF